MNTKLVAHVVFQFAVSVAFFSVLYFTWIKKIQYLILENQIKRVFADIAQDLVIVDVSGLRERIYSILKNSLAKERNSLIETDQLVEQSNQKVVIESAIVISVVVCVCIVISAWMVREYKLDWKDMVIDGLSCGLTLSVVLILFLYLVVNYYDLIDPNVVKKTILDLLIEYSKK